MNEAGSTTTPETVSAIAALAVAAKETEAMEPGEIVSAVTPNGYKRETIDFEQFLERPRNTRGIVSVVTLDDLIRYTKRHVDEAETTLWVNPDTRQVITVLDDHSKAEASWGQHRAILQLKHTEEWKFWIEQNEALQNQVEFAEHIEYGTPQIAAPDAGELFEMAQTFQATKDVHLNQASNLRDGSIQLDYAEDVKATAGGGKKEIPGEITLSMAPFVGEEKVAIDAAIYFRLAGPNLRIGYKLDHPDDVVRESLEKVAKKLTEEFGDNRVFLGSPRS
jgi:uncharacterized protein YfdQ (DUF2303 family)